MSRPITAASVTSSSRSIANDARVPRAQADTIVAALRGRGVHVEYMLAGDEGHSVARRANEVELFSRLLEFLRSAAPSTEHRAPSTLNYVNNPSQSGAPRAARGAGLLRA
jgi:hypothetical protein